WENVTMATLSVTKTGAEHFGTSFNTIKDALNAAATGDTILIGDGQFDENLRIDVEAITLKSVKGRGATTINGSDLSPLLGTIEIDPGMNNVTSEGLTIIAINGNGALEKAAVYIQGADTGL